MRTLIVDNVSQDLFDQIVHAGALARANGSRPHNGSLDPSGHPHITSDNCNCLNLAQPQPTASHHRAPIVSLKSSSLIILSYLHPPSSKFPAISTFAALSCTQKAQISRPLSLSTPTRRESRQFQWWATDQAGHTGWFQLSTFVLVNHWQSPRPWEKEGSDVAMCWTQGLNPKKDQFEDVPILRDLGV